VKNKSNKSDADFLDKQGEDEFHILAEEMPQIVWICLPDGSNIYFNKQWIDYTGLTMEESLGDGWNKSFHPEDQKRGWDAWQNAINNNAGYSLECRLRRADGVYQWWLIRALPSLDANGNVLKWVGTCTDINKLKLAEEEILMLGNSLKFVNECISITDMENNILFVNESFLNTYGYNASELIGKHISIVRSRDKSPALVGEILSATNGGGWKGELWNKRKDGSEFPVYLSTTVMNDKDNKPFGLIGVATDITDRRKANEEIKEAKRQLEQLYSHLTDVRENERAEISREIHDELGQSLTALKMDLNWIKDIVGITPIVQKKLDGMLELVSNSIKKVQNISANLRPGILDDLGLSSAIEWYCSEFENRSGIKCHLDLEDISGIDLKIQLAYFRILQEGLTNIARHANAKNVNVQLLLFSRHLYLKICDDGIGIGEDKINSKTSLGLIGIKERLREFNGTLEIKTSLKKGTSLIICVPLLTRD
jgi:PAS domain S-box-containing protein